MEGRTIRIRLVRESDAQFILSLRSDDKYNKYLSKTNSNVSDQVEWIKKYKVDETNKKQFYFIIEKLDGTPCGTVRIYDLQNDSFCWGSWILNESKTKYAAIESAFLVYRYGFEVIGCVKSHFDVRKDNEKVVSFHKRMGAVQTGEDKLNFYFEITKEAVANARLGLEGKL